MLFLSSTLVFVSFLLATPSIPSVSLPGFTWRFIACCTSWFTSSLIRSSLTVRTSAWSCRWAINWGIVIIIFPDNWTWSRFGRPWKGCKEHETFCDGLIISLVWLIVELKWICWICCCQKLTNWLVISSSVLFDEVKFVHVSTRFQHSSPYITKMSGYFRTQELRTSSHGMISAGPDLRLETFFFVPCYWHDYHIFPKGGIVFTPKY